MAPNSYPPSTKTPLSVYLEAGRTPRSRRLALTHSCQTSAGNSAMAGKSWWTPKQRHSHRTHSPHLHKPGLPASDNGPGLQQSLRRDPSANLPHKASYPRPATCPAPGMTCRASAG